MEYFEFMCEDYVTSEVTSKKGVCDVLHVCEIKQSLVLQQTLSHNLPHDNVTFFQLYCFVVCYF